MDRQAEQMGLVVELMCQSPAYRSFPLACLSAWIKPALEHRHIYFLFNDAGYPLAYWTWAFLAPDVEERWQHDPGVLFHESEWNEDGHLLSGTIAGNIACFEPRINLEQVHKSAQMACIHDEIMQMPMQNDTLVVDMGTSLSGGQKQRIVLPARYIASRASCSWMKPPAISM